MAPPPPRPPSKKNTGTRIQPPRAWIRALLCDKLLTFKKINKFPKVPRLYSFTYGTYLPILKGKKDWVKKIGYLMILSFFPPLFHPFLFLVSCVFMGFFFKKKLLPQANCHTCVDHKVFHITMKCRKQFI